MAVHTDLPATCGVAVALLLLGGCGSQAAPRGKDVSSESSLWANNFAKGKAMQLTGPFADGSLIEKKYSGEGSDRSPALEWTGVPDGAKSLLIICDDPDAPSPRKPAPTPWVHWVIFNIPADRTSLPEGVPRDTQPKEVAGACQGKNSWDRDNIGYRGPLPPPGSGTHRYFFRIYALDTLLKLPPDQATKESVLKAAQGHVLAQGQLMGKYQR